MRNMLSHFKKPWVPALTGLILVAAVTAVVMYLWGTPPSPAPEPVPEPSPVTVIDQEAGNQVHVAEVDIDAPGVWVAVHNVTEFGVGNVWGAARTREPRTDFVVPMIIATLPDKEYAIILYRDNGDSAFDRATDSVYIDLETGERVEERFRTLPN